MNEAVLKTIQKIKQECVQQVKTELIQMSQTIRYKRGMNIYQPTYKKQTQFKDILTSTKAFPNYKDAWNMRYFYKEDIYIVKNQIFIITILNLFLRILHIQISMQWEKSTINKTSRLVHLLQKALMCLGHLQLVVLKSKCWASMGNFKHRFWKQN